MGDSSLTRALTCPSEVRQSPLTALRSCPANQASILRQVWRKEARLVRVERRGTARPAGTAIYSFIPVPPSQTRFMQHEPMVVPVIGPKYEGDIDYLAQSGTEHLFDWNGTIRPACTCGWRDAGSASPTSSG